MPSAKLAVPKFTSEKQEARWWDNHMNEVEGLLHDAMRTGRVQRGTAAKLAAAASPSKNITIRMPLEDIDRARRLAGK